MEVAFLEGASGVVEGAELDGDAGADADEWGEGAFVEGEGAFLLEDGGGTGGGAGVARCGLQADFDYVWVGLDGDFMWWWLIRWVVECDLPNGWPASG